MRNTSLAWGGLAQLLHWLVVALLITQYTLGWIAADLPLSMQKLVLLSRHKSFGMLILGLAILRLLWRMANPTPALPAHMPVFQQRLARATHAVLYACLFALPLSGWIMSSARSFPVSVFGIVQLPDLVSPGETMFLVSRSVHVGLTWVLLATVTLHVAGALKHHFIDRDTVLRRMLPFNRIH
jgi:cytochrome b561